MCHWYCKRAVRIFFLVLLIQSHVPHHQVTCKLNHTMVIHAWSIHIQQSNMTYNMDGHCVVTMVAYYYCFYYNRRKHLNRSTIFNSHDCWIFDVQFNIVLHLNEFLFTNIIMQHVLHWNKLIRRSDIINYQVYLVVHEKKSLMLNTAIRMTCKMEIKKIKKKF